MLGIGGESNDKLISNALQLTPTDEYTSVGQTAEPYIYQLCANIRCCLVDLPKWWSIGMNGKREPKGSVPLVCLDGDNESFS